MSKETKSGLKIAPTKIVWQLRSFLRDYDNSYFVVNPETKDCGILKLAYCRAETVALLEPLKNVAGIVQIQTLYLHALVLECHGHPISSIMKKVPYGPKFPVSTVLEVGFQVAQILTRIHQRGVVHGNISVSNIVAQLNGTVALINPANRVLPKQTFFTSVSVTLGNEPTPADDWTSLIYVLAFMEHGLPWETRMTEMEALALKAKIPPRDLFKDEQLKKLIVTWNPSSHAKFAWHDDIQIKLQRPPANTVAKPPVSGFEWEVFEPKPMVAVAPKKAMPAVAPKKAIAESKAPVTSTPSVPQVHALEQWNKGVPLPSELLKGKAFVVDQGQELSERHQFIIRNEIDPSHQFVVECESSGETAAFYGPNLLAFLKRRKDTMIMDINSGVLASFDQLKMTTVLSDGLVAGITTDRSGFVSARTVSGHVQRTTSIGTVVANSAKVSDTYFVFGEDGYVRRVGNNKVTTSWQICDPATFNVRQGVCMAASPFYVVVAGPSGSLCVLHHLATQQYEKWLIKDNILAVKFIDCSTCMLVGPCHVYVIDLLNLCTYRYKIAPIYRAVIDKWNRIHCIGSAAYHGGVQHVSVPAFNGVYRLSDNCLHHVFEFDPSSAAHMIVGAVRVTFNLRGTMPGALKFVPSNVSPKCVNSFPEVESSRKRKLDEESLLDETPIDIRPRMTTD